MSRQDDGYREGFPNSEWAKLARIEGAPPGFESEWMASSKFRMMCETDRPSRLTGSTKDRI